MENSKYKDPLERLLKEHVQASEYLDNLDKLLALLLEKDGWSNAKTTEEFFEENILKHFDYEERLFLALLSENVAPEATKLMLDLTKEHGRILRELEEFRRIISNNTPPFDEATKKRLNTVGRTIREELLRHARKEDVELIPVLEKNRELLKKLD
jgi:iron-sulfur cluster repair protein YtfE (RIC family)